MKEYVHGIKISDVKEIYGGGGNCNRSYLHVKFKNGHKETFVIVTTDNTSFKLEREMRRELMEAYVEYNNIPERYYPRNTVFATINGNSTPVGVSVVDRYGFRVDLTLKEFDKVEKEFKVIDNNYREMSYIHAFSIGDGKINSKIDKKWIEQLEYMGYDISKLEYELKEC